MRECGLAPTHTRPPRQPPAALGGGRVTRSRLSCWLSFSFPPTPSFSLFNDLTGVQNTKLQPISFDPCVCLAPGPGTRRRARRVPYTRPRPEDVGGSEKKKERKNEEKEKKDESRISSSFLEREGSFSPPPPSRSLSPPPLSLSLSPRELGESRNR